MPVISFKYTHQNETGIPSITTNVILPYRLPQGTRFTLKQVSASNNETSYLNMLKYVTIYINELMGSTNHTYFHTSYELPTVDINTINEPGLRFYSTQLIPQSIQAFPNLHLGRFFLQTNELHLTIQGVGQYGPTNISDFTVVLEYDTE